MQQKHTVHFTVNDISTDRADLEAAADLLAAGGLVAIPTETGYGLGASIYFDDAVKGIFAAKGRPQDNPLIVHVDTVEMAKTLYDGWPAAAQKLADAFWPGPLTIIYKKSDRVSSIVSGGLSTVAVRMPVHPVAHALISLSGQPIAAPSANLSGSPSPTTARHVVADLEGRVDGIVLSGDCQVGVESTVVSIDGPRPCLLRPGAVTPQQLRQVLGEIDISPAVLSALKEGQTAQSPGMKYKHYAPKAQVYILAGGFDSYCDFVAAHAGPGVFALCFSGEEQRLPVPCVTYGAQDDPDSQAARLFTALRELDERGAKTVYARAPQKDGVSLAVYNRLLRAAAFRVQQLG